MKVFNTAFKVTQKFGVNKDYYGQFGLEGHEGLDIIPTGPDWSIFSLPYKGKVVKDIDMKEKGGAYGITCTIWYPDISEAWQYCHLSTNTVYEGQEIEPAYYIGQMGSTGNSTGPHLHVNRFKVNASGIRQNKDNGFLGGIDPLPLLEQEVSVPTQPAITFTDQTKIPLLGKPWGELEIQAIRSTLNDQVTTIQKKDDRIQELDKLVESLQKVTFDQVKQIESLQITLDECREYAVSLQKASKTVDEATVGELVKELLRRLKLV